jgi:hypothetical protein
MPDEQSAGIQCAKEDVRPVTARGMKRALTCARQ